MMRRGMSVAMLLLLYAVSATAAQNSRSYTTGKFAMELDGQPVGFLRGVSGGFASAEVIEEPDSPDHYFKKHLALPATFSDIAIEFDRMSTSFYQWIKDSIDRGLTRHSGSIIALDSTNKILRKMDFSSAQITEVVFSPLDAGSKSAYTMTAVIKADNIWVTLGGGTYTAIPNQKKLLSSMFRLRVGALPTSRVSSIEALRIAIPPALPPNTVCRTCPSLELRISYPVLEVVLPEADAADWFTWHESFVLQGISDDSAEKSGTLELLNTGGATVFKLSFEGLGIVTVANEPATSTNSTARVRASMYTEKLSLTQHP